MLDECMPVQHKKRLQSPIKFNLWFTLILFSVDDAKRQYESALRITQETLMTNYAPNPVSVTVPADSSGSIICNSHAAYYQQAIVSNNGAVIGTFGGSGENVPMKLENGDEVLNIGGRSAVRLSIQFNYSESGSGGPFQPSNVLTPVIENTGNGEIINITTEDSTDNDDNDTYMTITYQSL